MYQSKKKPSFWHNPNLENSPPPPVPTEPIPQKDLPDEKSDAVIATFVPPISRRPNDAPIPLQVPPSPSPLQTRPTPPPPPAIFPPHLRRRHGLFTPHYKPMMPPAPPPRPIPPSSPLFRQRGKVFLQTAAIQETLPTATAPQTPQANPPANIGDEEVQESEPQSQIEFDRANPKEGVLRVETFIAGRALPVTDVNIVVTHRIGNDDIVYYNVTTNEVGIVDGLTLPAPDAATSQSPDMENPFATYTLYATRDSYMPQGPIEIQIFDSVKTIQPIVMQWRPVREG